MEQEVGGEFLNRSEVVLPLDLKEKMVVSFGENSKVFGYEKGVYRAETVLEEEGGVAGGQVLTFSMRSNYSLGGLKSFGLADVKAGGLVLFGNMRLNVGINKDKERAESRRYLPIPDKISLGRLATSVDLLGCLHEWGHRAIKNNGRLEDLLQEAEELSGIPGRYKNHEHKTDYDAYFKFKTEMVIGEVVASLFAMRKILGFRNTGVDLFPGDLETNGVKKFFDRGIAGYTEVFKRGIDNVEDLIDLRISNL